MNIFSGTSLYFLSEAASGARREMSVEEQASKQACK